MCSMNHFAMQLLDWHDGQSSGLYAVGSSLNANKYPDMQNMIRAIRELRKTKAPTKLANTLQLMLECNKEYCAPYQIWLEKHSL